MEIQPLDAENWLESVPFSLKIGGVEKQGSLASIMVERQQILAKGGHLLRQLDVNRIAGKEDIFRLDIIVEWKGQNSAGKAVLAKIHQEITIKILNDNSWQVESIKERHLLPDIAPWVGLLC